jgi:anti-anti-sigma factor
MAGQTDTVHGFLKWFDRSSHALYDTLYASLHLSTTAFATLPAEQQQLFVQRVVGCLREALATRNLEPLATMVFDDSIQSIQPIAFDDVQTFFILLRRGVFAALTGAVLHDPTSGVVGLERVASVIEEVRIRTLQDRLAQVEHQAAQQTSTLHMFQVLAEHATDGIMVAAPNEDIIYANPAFRAMTGYGDDVLTMKSFDLIYEDITQLHEVTRQILSHDVWQGIITYRRKDGTTFAGHASTFPIYHDDETIAARDMQAWVAIVRDVTEQLQAEQEQLRLKEQVIAIQRDTLRTLSTPLIPLDEHIVAMPIIGEIDQDRAQHITTTLLEGIAAHRATVAILDITGVHALNSHNATLLVQAAQAARLLGAQVVLTGISPDIARTLVRLNIDMGAFVTFARFQKGIAFAFAHTSSVLWGG